MTALALFIENPEHAAPEAALAAVIPAETAANVYERMLVRLRNLTASFAGEKYLFYSHYPNWNDAWNINTYRKRIQSGESIPSRINAAVSDISEEHPDSIIWLGTEAMVLEPADLERFASAGANADLVIGETGSGKILALGFGPLAFRFEIPETFNMEEILAIAENSGLNVVRVNLPTPPTSVQGLAQLGITID